MNSLNTVFLFLSPCINRHEFERSKADACNFIIFSQSTTNGGNIPLWVGRCIVVFLAGIKSFFFIYYLKKFNKNTKLSIFNYSLYNIEIGTKLRALLLAESSTKIQLFSSRLFKFEFSSLYYIAVCKGIFISYL